MKVILKPTFQRDSDKIKNQELLHVLRERLIQLNKATHFSEVDGLKKMRSYVRAYRITVKTSKHSYRIGAIIRGDTIWLVRFLPRKIIYKKFP